MKINNINHFQVNPVNLDMPRSRIGRDYGNTTTFNSGKLIPIYVKEVIPAETVQLNYSSVIRSITPAVPVMDNAFVDFFFFFVPNRLCTVGAQDWQKVCGENVNGFWAPTSETTLVSSGNTLNLKDLTAETVGGVSYKVSPQSLLNYLGCPVLPASRVGTGSSNVSGVINTLACRAYYRIYDEWFRDENTQSPVLGTVNKNDFGKTTSLVDVNKYHDIFTSTLPSPQKGQSVLLPLGTVAPVITSNNYVQTTAWPLKFERNNGQHISPSANTRRGLTLIDINNSGKYNVLGTNSAPGTIVDRDGNTLVSNDDIEENALIPNNLWADLSQATAASVNELRNAFAIQRMFEKDSRGSRYWETLLNHFGVSNPDLILQRPEYLTGKRVPLNITQVVQTSETSDGSPLGSTGAFSNTASSDYGFTKSFGEYGLIIGLCCVRTSQSYSQGLPKFMLRNRRFDFYWPSFANIGEQPILKKELYFGNSSSDNDAVFGYQEAWADYRYKGNMITGYFNPDAGDTSLTAWTYTNKFLTYPTLNSDFMKQPKSQIDGTLAYQESPYQFIANFYFVEKLDLPMPLYSIPGLIDHH